MLQLDPTIMRLLLNHFGWDKQKLLEIYYGSGDTDKLFKDAKILESVKAMNNENEVDSSDGCSQGASLEEKEEEDCQICYLSQPISVSTVISGSIQIAK